MPSRKPRPGSRLPVPLHFFLSRSDRDGRGAASCLVSLSLGGTFQRPVRRFLSATSISLRRRPLPGIFQAGPVLIGTGGRPHTLDNPILPPCHATQALRARCQGRQGIWPSKAFTLAPTSPGGDHFPRTRKLGSCVSPPTSAPAPPRHNALWCIRGRNGSKSATARKGGDKFMSPSLFLHENPACSSPFFEVCGEGAEPGGQPLPADGRVSDPQGAGCDETSRRNFASEGGEVKDVFKDS